MHARLIWFACFSDPQILEAKDVDAQLNAEREQQPQPRSGSGVPPQAATHAAQGPAAVNGSSDLSSSAPQQRQQRQQQQQQQQQQQEQEQEQEQQQQRQQAAKQKAPKQQRCAIYNGVRFHLDVTAGLAWAFQVGLFCPCFAVVCAIACRCRLRLHVLQV